MHRRSEHCSANRGSQATSHRWIPTWCAHAAPSAVSPLVLRPFDSQAPTRRVAGRNTTAGDRSAQNRTEQKKKMLRRGRSVCIGDWLGFDERPINQFLQQLRQRCVVTADSQAHLRNQTRDGVVSIRRLAPVPGQQRSIKLRRTAWCGSHAARGHVSQLDAAPLA